MDITSLILSNYFILVSVAVDMKAPYIHKHIHT